ncbi:MAG: FAD-dependent oxidoreductase [Clostridia bacterium]|nr:FAD-dependent oxidoreductase [Clostridia bacterium]
MKLSYLENGKQLTEEVKNINFDMECDVLCIGMGAAGAYAAISAAREGASVIALERDENIGGMPITGMVPTFYYGEVGGTFEKVEKNAIELDKFFEGGYIHTESRHCELFRLISTHKIKLLCSSLALGVYFDGKRAIGVRALIRGEQKNIASKMLIDATSEGHIISMCPVKTYFGRIADGKAAPFTNRIDYLDEDGFYGYYNDDDGYRNQYDPVEISKSIINAHASKLEFLMKENKEIISVAPNIGVREGKRFEGEEMLSYKDILFMKKPQKTLLYCRSDLDRHGRDLAIDDEIYQNWWVISNLSTVTAKIALPMGAVVPKGLDGILSAGRCISLDSYSSSAVRMNRDMFRIGECVGIAVAIAAKSNKYNILDIDYDEYLMIARKYSAFDGAMKDDFAFDSPNGKLYRSVRFDLTDDEIFKGLNSESPGEAIWSCYISGEKAAEKLLNEYDGQLHYAIALGMMGRKEALPRLREEVRNRNLDYFVGCRRSNQYKTAAAICLLGRLGNENDIELLSTIVFDSRERKNPMYSMPNAPLVYASERMAYGYYQLFTHAVMAIIKLSKKLGKKAEYLDKFQELFTGDSRNEIIDFISRGTPESASGQEISEFLDNALKILKAE